MDKIAVRIGLSRALGKIKEHYDLKVSDIARMIGVSDGAVWYWLEGINAPSARHRGKVKAFLQNVESVVTEYKKHCGDDAKVLFGARLRVAMADRGVTIAGIVEALDVTANTVYAWQSGEKLAHIRNMKRLAKYLGVRQEWLRGEIDEQGLSELPEHGSDKKWVAAEVREQGRSVAKCVAERVREQQIAAEL